MPKTIVCIVSDDPIINYLFVKEKYKSGDEVLLIASQYTKNKMKQLKNVLDVPSEAVRFLTLDKEYDEEVWDTMCRTIRRHLSADKHYFVNLAGGTRFMSLAVQVVFAPFDTQYFFVSGKRNMVISSMIDDNNDDNDDKFFTIKYRLSVCKYLKVNGLKVSTNQLTRDYASTKRFFDMFVNGLLSNQDYDNIDILRNSYRNSSSIDIDVVENQPGTKAKPRIYGLSNFLGRIGFVPETPGVLNNAELRFLTGGWFEEYVYYKIKEDINPDSIEVGVAILRDPSPISNDLDVVFTLCNKLFVVECKTGVEKSSTFHQIAYKACALHESLLGMSSHAYICSLSSDNKENLTMMARNMDIWYCDRSYFTDPNKWQTFIEKVKTQAYGK